MPEYNEIFKSTLKEVLTQYGDVFDVWFDGANGDGDHYFRNQKELKQRIDLHDKR